MIGIGISTTLTRASGPGPAPRPLLLIVAGQSNAGKQGTSGLTPPAKYADLSSFRIWNGSAFADYVVGANPGDYPAAWGSEAEVVYRLRAMGSARPVYMVKRAEGGTALAAESGSDWTPGSGELFAQAAARVSAARAAILAVEGQPPEEITLWNQGERDIQNAAHAAAYAGNFAAFLAAWRAQVSAGLFVVERSRPFPGHYGASFMVRKAQLDTALADGTARVIDSDFPVADPWSVLHPGPDWCEGLGARAFDAWRGTYAATWGDIADATPDAFGFVDLTGQPPGALVMSQIVEPAGFSRDVAVSVTGGAYRVLHPDDTVASDWTSAPGRLHRWQKVQLRLTTDAGYETTASAVLTLGDVAATWSATTAAQPQGATAEYLIVGGGGPGGQGGGAGVGAGGGGGGGVLTGTRMLEPGSYPVTVGAGGPVSTSNGGASSAFGLTALGGGRGADTVGGTDLPGHDGASGGGGSGHNVGFDISGGAGLQGNPGGAGYAHGSDLSRRNGGGGGGAGAAGEAAGADHGGAGGEGLVSAITGTAVVYGAGGGGGQSGSAGKYAGFPPGGTNAGNGAWKDQSTTVPVPGTGAGGGGSSGAAAPTAGAAGLVVVAYPSGSLTANGGAVTSAGGMNVHRFTESGVFEVTAVG